VGWERPVYQISGLDGDGEPEFTESRVAFNGRASRDESCEPFVVDLGRISTFEFCKTRRNPYDLLVKAALCLLEDTFADEIAVSSDGTVEEWQRGLELARRVRPQVRDPGFFSRR
jgi:hypothetical protein